MFLEVSADLLSRGYSVRFRPGGHSMSPTIRDGEAVTVEPIDARDVRRGDIILYRHGRKVTAHRVVEVRRGEREPPVFVTRGDASAACDDPVAAAQVLGRVVAVERHERKINLTGRKALLLRIARVHLRRLKAYAANRRLPCNG